ncbi:MAG: hypothetical protein J6B29_06265 [Clostridia bacterium]|nr:hypothetical protein [Clostridia bacterium]
MIKAKIYEIVNFGFFCSVDVLNLDFTAKIIYYINSDFIKEVAYTKGIDKTVVKETGFICVWLLIFSAVMQAVFILLGRWDYTVLLGNLLSGFAGAFNFLLLGVTVQRAVGSGNEKYARRLMRISWALRLIMMASVAILGATAPCFNLWATVIPLLFPRLAMVIRQLTLNRQEGKSDE